MSGKRPEGSLHACRELMANADSHAATNGGTEQRLLTPCPELEEEVSALLEESKTFGELYPVDQVTEND